MSQEEASASSSSLSSGIGGASPSETAVVAGRQLVYDLIASGKIGEAVSEVSRIFTSAPIDCNHGLGFKIKVRS